MALGDTNTIGLDDSSCGRNLRVGQWQAGYCPVNDPGFMIYGDGGMPTYEWFVDGVKQPGVAGGTGRIVCLKVSSPLPDGKHTVTANELTPNKGKPVTPLDVIIDTYIPTPPTITGIASYTDTGPLGDHITTWHSPTVVGTAEKLSGSSVQLYLGPTLKGGAVVAADGSFSVATGTMLDGEYDFQAIQATRSGNRSARSSTFHLTIAQTDVPPTPVPDAPTGVAAARSVKISWAAVAGATGYGVFSGPAGNETTLVAEVPGTALDYTISNAQPGLYYRVRAKNATGWSAYSTSV